MQSLARAAGLVLVLMLAAPPSLEAGTKQFYDRILGETTLEELEQLALGEEQSLKLPPEQQSAQPPSQIDAELHEALTPPLQ